LPQKRQKNEKSVLNLREDDKIQLNELLSLHHPSSLLLYSKFLIHLCFSYTRCLPNQRDALLEFKNEFELRNPPKFLNESILDGSLTWADATSYPKTKSWANKSDCCSWDGITCDAKSGEVIGIDLSCSCLYGHFKPNSSLFRLRQLRNLNLAYNNFNASPVPTRLNKLMELERLNFSHSSFSGQIPPEILHLTKLVSLDLSSSFTFFFRICQVPGWLSRLPELYHVNLSNNRFSGFKEFPKDLSRMQMKVINLSKNNLQVLILRSNEFHGSLQYHPRVASWFPQLRVIDISHNNAFTGTLPSEFFMYWSAMHSEGDRSELKYIGDYSYYQDSMVFTNKGIEMRYDRILTVFTAIDLSKGLIVLNLSSNGFTGNIPSSMANFTQLESLDLSHNKLSGQIPPDLAHLTNLPTNPTYHSHRTLWSSSR
ncbi:probably inactive leucine-rich repeat receptor-like protein kinase At3g28040, partial [Eutrema salsugineum]|uniref:probably inactive leucine-rich repeat receptor-like protein kinase At3g28040 n=1 Tax=Eutrema salsugineum TaxID=72664 RepID=UPI000CED0C5C